MQAQGRLPRRFKREPGHWHRVCTFGAKGRSTSRAAHQVKAGMVAQRARVETEARKLVRSGGVRWLAINRAGTSGSKLYPGLLRLRQSLDAFRIGSAVPAGAAPPQRARFNTFELSDMEDRRRSFRFRTLKSVKIVLGLTMCRASFAIFPALVLVLKSKPPTTFPPSSNSGCQISQSAHVKSSG
jgi:hypothetical protein